MTTFLISLAVLVAYLVAFYALAVQGVSNSYATFWVWTPTAGRAWSLYQAAWWKAPAIFLAWLAVGVRTRIWGPPLGRTVTVADMLGSHPRGKCLCNRTGVLTTYRREKPGDKDMTQGVQFCAKMLEAFRKELGWRVSDSKTGPRWVKGFAPEELVNAVPSGSMGR